MRGELDIQGFKLALGKHLELALHGFQIGNSSSKNDLLCQDHAGPLLGHPKMYSTS